MKITATGPDELVAAVPFLLGFTPAESMVLVPVSPGMPVARIDMPRDEAERVIVADQLADPFLRHAHNSGPDPKLALVCLTEDREVAARAAEAISDALWPQVAVPVKIWATERDWTNLDTGERGARTTDPGSRFAAEAVAAGRQLPAAAREDLARTLTGGDREGLRTALPSAIAALETSSVDQERRWAENRINRFLDDGIALSDVDAARLLVGVRALPVRDAAWAMMTQDDHHAHRALWTDLTRRSPGEVRAPAATLLAFSAWLGGDGAGAWTALDQIPAEQADYRLAGLMSSVLETAVPPSQWTSTIRPALLAQSTAEEDLPRSVDVGRDRSPDLEAPGDGVRPRPEQRPAPTSPTSTTRPPAR